MEESIRKLLGMRKGSRIGLLFYEIRKIFSLKLMLILLLFVILAGSYIIFTKYEVMRNPDFVEQVEEYGVSPYFISFFWLIGTLAVGYAESPMTTVGRAVDLFLILLSAIVIAIFISQLTSRLVSINLGNMFGMSRTRKRVDYILCGWNPISEAALSELQGTGSEIVIIDKENRPELAKAKDVHFIAGDPTNPDILKRSNITNAKNIVLAMDDDSEVLLAIHVIRDLNPWINIVAKINHHEHIKIAESAGADQVVSPSSIGGRLLSMVTEEPAAVEWLLRATAGERGMELKEYTVSKDSVFANRKIGQIRTELRDKAKIIGVDTVKGLEKVPSDDLVVEPGNKLLMLIDSSKFDLE